MGMTIAPLGGWGTKNYPSKNPLKNLSRKHPTIALIYLTTVPWSQCIVGILIRCDAPSLLVGLSETLIDGIVCPHAIGAEHCFLDAAKERDGTPVIADVTAMNIRISYPRGFLSQRQTRESSQEMNPHMRNF